MRVSKNYLVLFLVQGPSCAVAAQDGGVALRQQQVPLVPRSERVGATQIDAGADQSTRVPQIGSTNLDGEPTRQSPNPTRDIGTYQDRGHPTAWESAPLSHPSDGRTAKVDRIGGHDRCASSASSAGPRCDRVIENRAAEYARPSRPTLSPEQKLLVDQRVREGALIDRVARDARVGASEVKADDLEGQAIATVAQAISAGQNASTDQATSKPLPDASAAVIEALVGSGSTVQRPR